MAAEYVFRLDRENMNCPFSKANFVALIYFTWTDNCCKRKSQFWIEIHRYRMLCGCRASSSLSRYLAREWELYIKCLYWYGHGHVRSLDAGRALLWLKNSYQRIMSPENCCSRAGILLSTYEARPQQIEMPTQRIFPALLRRLRQGTIEPPDAIMSRMSDGQNGVYHQIDQDNANGCRTGHIAAAQRQP